MNGRTLILLVMAIAIAALMVVMVKNRTTTAQTASGPRVMVASTNITAGSFINSEKNLTWAEWPQASISPSFLPEGTRKVEEFNGGVARRDIAPGEPITTNAIVRASEGGFMSAVLTPGKRAVSIAVNSISGNAGFVFPGDHVDLILTHKVQDGMLASETFIEDLRVLAIDQMLNNPENKAVIAKTITLEVNPKQAEMINVAISIGAISVSLRSLAQDTDKPKIENATAPADTLPPGEALPNQPVNTYSTNHDVSKLMDEKGSSGAKVNVYHGSGNTEQLNFQENK